MTTAFFNKTHDEAVALLFQAYGFAADQHNRARGAAPGDPQVEARAGCEALRVTTRLAEIVAWLLVQKAVYAGEISAGEARAQPNRLSRNSMCIALGGEDDLELAAELRDLLSRSRRLYVRVGRLDELLDRSDGF